MLTVASHPAVWRATPLLLRTLDQLRANPPPEQQSLLLRSMATAASCRSWIVSDADLALLARLPNLRKFEMCVQTLSDAQWLQLVPVLAALEELRLTMYYPFTSAAQLHSIATLDRLHTLELGRAEDDATAWRALLRRQQLTSLRFEDNVFDAFSLRLRAIGQSGEPLRCRLSVLRPSLNGANFREVLSLPAFAALQWLCLDDFDAAGLPQAPLDPAVPTTAADFIAGFAALTSLTTLRLEQPFNVNQLLPHAHHALALQRLEVVPMDVQRPSVDVIMALLADAPELRCNVYVFTSEEHDHYDVQRQRWAEHPQAVRFEIVWS
jgi:hypothetical protein